MEEFPCSHCEIGCLFNSQLVILEFLSFIMNISKFNKGT